MRPSPTLSRLRPTALLLGLLALAPLLTSCASSGITPRGNVQLSYTPARIMPATENGDGAILRMPDGGFVVCEAMDDTVLSLRRYTDALEPGWAAPVMEPKVESSFRFARSYSGAFGFGFMPTVKEAVMSMTMAGDAISLLSYRFGEEDSIYVIGRLYDPKTGAQLRNDVLYSTVLHEDLETDDRRAFSSVSPDSSRLIVYNYIPGADESELSLNMAVIGGRGQLLRRAILSLKASEGERRSLQSIEIDNAGNVYLVTIDNDTTIRVERHPTEGAVSTMRASFSGTDDAELGRVKVRFEANDRLMLSAPITVDDALVGIALARMNMRESSPPLTKTIAISEDKLESEVEIDEYEFPWLHSIIETKGPTPLVFVLESRFTKEITTTTTSATGASSSSRTMNYAMAGDILMVGCGAEGDLRWLSRIEKNEGRSLMIPLPMSWYYQQMSFKPNVTSTNRLHVLLRDEEGLRLREVNLADGGHVSPRGDLLLTMGGAATVHPHFTTWLNDNEVIMFCMQGVFSKDLNLYRMNYATR